MKNKISIKKLLALVIFVASLLPVQGQRYLLSHDDGSTSSYSVGDIQKITFDESFLNLFLIDGSSYSWDLNTVNNTSHSDVNSINDLIIKRVNTLNVNVFPNPISKKINISYLLSDDCLVEVSIYDLSGKHISLLINEKQFKGGNIISKSIGNVQSGTYLVTIRGEKFITTKKIIIK